MKKTSLALLVYGLLCSNFVFAEEPINFEKLLNERDITSIQAILEQNPNSSEAAYYASVYYGIGDDELGTNKDDAKKEEYLKKSADLGYAEAELQYGFSLLNEGQADEGLKYINKSADQNYLKAISLLGDLYFAGYQDQENNEVVQQDIAKAIQYLEKAVEQNSVSARYTLGYIYLDETLGHQDIPTALALFESNIDYENQMTDISSLIALIDFYENGDGVEKNRDKLIDYYYLASLQDYAPSLYAIGMLQRTGAQGEKISIAKDQEAAFINLAKAAQLGHIDAMFRVGEMHFKGEGTEQSDVNAYIWTAIAEDLTGNKTNYSETILELIPKRQRQIAIDNKNHYRQFFTMPKAESSVNAASNIQVQ